MGFQAASVGLGEIKYMFEYEHYYQLIKTGCINKATEYRASFVPNYLYKFISLSSDISLNNKKLKTLENSSIWLSSYTQLNDPYELSGMYIDIDKLTRLGYQANDIDYLQRLFEGLKNTMYIASFTDSMTNNLPMWAHYANNHKGFCVKYLVKNKLSIRNVIYESQRIQMARTLEGYIQMDRQHINEEIEARNTFYSILISEIFNLKHISWHSENEYRLLYPSEEVSSTGFEVSLDEVGLEISEVYSGYKCSPDYQCKLDNICSVLGVKHYRCNLSDTEYIVFE